MNLASVLQTTESIPSHLICFSQSMDFFGLTRCSHKSTAQVRREFHNNMAFYHIHKYSKLYFQTGHYLFPTTLLPLFFYPSELFHLKLSDIIRLKPYLKQTCEYTSYLQESKHELLGSGLL